MTVQELIDALEEYDPYLQVGIRDPYADTAQQIGSIYEDNIDHLCEDTIVYIEGGQLL